eukprot:scaffold65_cov353-Prasinococcus_capsulatus_cf.AAC.11
MLSLGRPLRRQSAAWGPSPEAFPFPFTESCQATWMGPMGDCDMISDHVSDSAPRREPSRAPGAPDERVNANAVLKRP